MPPESAVRSKSSVQYNAAMTKAPDTAIDPLIQQVGERVRIARTQMGMPRRQLSELSGVSPRYLAQLEGGDGNISIALLHRIAGALRMRIEWLVAEDDPRTSDVIKVAELFRSADEATQARVLRQLSPIPPTHSRAQRVCLIGLRGAGKSTLGRAAAGVLDMPFVELNKEIEAIGGMPIAEIMGLYGADGYRKLEADALEAVTAEHDRMVLAVAGGIVAEPRTFSTLLDTCHTVWLRATPMEHMNRVRAQGDERPMAGVPEAMSQLRSLLASRESLYAQAEAQLDTSSKTVDQSLNDLLDLIEESAFLSKP
ncbi:helix-turn-helix transcriptional regulator [Flavimaricola marinus]|uniref:Shikimate kinase n=1 Tax=Flavimaricola marinus TaxID=1819565 RepID=A0A238LDB0_9RHOB|nr:helix-turn-helix transcriptional regulator [Flavimaricola marinus]SMY06910.1 Shikimate kinase [Flavimaricola marinus]